MKIALGGVSFVPNLNIHKRPIGRFMESPIPLGKMMENDSSVARVKIRFSVDNKKEETSMGSQEFGGSNKEQLEKLKGLLDQMNTSTSMCSYVQQGDISKGLITFSVCYSDPWIPKWWIGCTTPEFLYEGIFFMLRALSFLNPTYW